MPEKLNNPLGGIVYLYDISELPEEIFNADELPRNWGFARGGFPMESDKHWYVYRVDKKLDKHVYPMPLFLNGVVEGQVKQAVHKLKYDFKKLMGIDEI